MRSVDGMRFRIMQPALTEIYYFVICNKAMDSENSLKIPKNYLAFK